ncbi:glycosyltransferase [Streptococcus saliviloxodontae]|uniref:Glycosyltransferase involved in cell wall biosynthesis n=1 Tax=Streptococcus saliviloxodontae TaxID=1349416 RepID=A0ABS2PLE5_9STRE|nr:glycosyltransferase [Streptococcus saliviloxodontae]MBM7636259.1 glycosyltransferase involved in cell wall biosynthesis [Streptococcus saliviloxodontae]
MYIIIPSYEPDHRLVQVVTDIRRALPQANIILVNDGSGASYHYYFKQCAQLGVHLLEHPQNLGKGAALKTAFAFIKDHKSQSTPIITVDSDGQHLIKDIIKVAEVSQKHPRQIILGSRSFVGKVPARSRFGNKTTALLFKLVTGQGISDTQTGLRAVSTDLLDWLLQLKGDRFEYEFNMLLEANKAGYPILEVPIETVYLEENKSSHFRPIADSIRIYSPFLKFSSSAIIAAIIDVTFLFLLMSISNNLLLSVIIARLLSASSQCLLNAKLVFNTKQTIFRSFLKYSLLASILLACNYVMIQSLLNIGLGIVISKFLTESILFLISYRVQHKVVFR